MSIEISPEVQNRLLATAEAEGVPVDAFLAQLIDEHQELRAIIERTGAHAPLLAQEEIQAKIERAFLQSERGEVVSGETFMTDLLHEIDELERKPTR